MDMHWIIAIAAAVWAAVNTQLAFANFARRRTSAGSARLLAGALLAAVALYFALSKPAWL